MKVKEEYTSFTGQISVGHISRFIKITEDGYEVPVKELIDRTKHFYRIVLCGNPFYDRKDVPKLIKKTLKYNPDVMFEIYSLSNVRPIGVGKFNNVHYYVNVPLKKEGGSFDDRISTRAINWFIDMRAKFVFDVSNEDDVDEVITIINMTGIPKMLVYLSPKNANILDDIMKYCIKYKFNFAPNFRKFLWKDFGREI